MIRVVIVDDHPIFRDGLRRSLGEEAGLEVCGEGVGAADAVDLAARLRPDVLLLDLSMPGGGLDAIPHILSASPTSRVVVLTAFEEDDNVYRALSAGAVGYVLKGVGSEELAAIVRSVHAGGSYVVPDLAARLLRDAQPPRDPARQAILETLSVREREVLQDVSRGLSNKEIARRLDLQEKTIKNQMTRILQKLGARNRMEAAMMIRDLRER